MRIFTEFNKSNIEVLLDTTYLGCIKIFLNPEAKIVLSLF